MRKVLPLLILFFVFSAHAAGEVALNSQEEAFIKAMPLRKKIGQLLVIGFNGQSISEGLGDTIQTVAPGGVLIFGRNISSARQISTLLIDAQKASYKTTKLPLLVATDQEGGDVIRVKTSMPLPSALALGKAGRTDIAIAAGYATGKLLKTLGINMDLAPVLDVSDSAKPMFIGTRTFGSDPQTVAKIGTSFSEGLMKAGVLPTGKHFPGHGGVAEDSHVALPAKQETIEELRATDLVPFAAMQARFPNKWAAMLAHVAYPKIDASGEPATLSKKIVTGILRKEMAFDGLVITDDIGMAGAGKAKDTREHAVRAIEAGADMVVIAWNRKLQKGLVDSIEQAVRSGRISRARIDQSIHRIFLAKKSFATPKLEPPTEKQLQLVLQSPTFTRVGDATVTSRFNQAPDESGRSFKDFAAGKPVIIFSANDRFSRTFRDVLSDRDTRTFKLDVDRPYDVGKILGANPGAVGVFYVSGYQAAKVAGSISEDLARRILLVTVETPAILKNAASFRHTADVYYRHPNLGRMIAERYFSGEEAETPGKDLRVPASKVLPRGAAANDSPSK